MDKNMNTRKTGAELIAIERQRQINEEGWTPNHDKYLIDHELAFAAICYADPNKRLIKRREGDDGTGHRSTYLENGPEGPGEYIVMPPTLWPWALSQWKPTPDDRIRELTKAGALIAAEIDRLTELEEKTKE